MLKYIFLPFLLASFALCAQDDYSHFLNVQRLEVEQKQGHANVFPGGHDEKYFVVDENGTHYKMRLKNVGPLLAEVIASLIQTDLGIPHLRVYPTFVERGVHGLPDAQTAFNLSLQNGITSPHNGYGKAGRTPFPFQATVQEIGKLSAYPVRLNGQILASYLIQMHLNSILGNNDLQISKSGRGNIGFVDGHFVTLDFAQSFKFYDEEDFDSLSKRFVTSIAQLYSDYSEVLSSEKEIESLRHQLATYSYHLEHLDVQKFEGVFHKYSESVNFFRSRNALPPIDHFAIFKHRIQKARSSLYTSLDQLGIAHQVDINSAVKNVLDVKFPRLSTDPKTAEDILWTAFFESNPVRIGTLVHQARALFPNKTINKITDIAETQKASCYHYLTTIIKNF